MLVMFHLASKKNYNFVYDKIIPLLNSHSISTNYILRICCIQTIEQLMIQMEFDHDNYNRLIEILKVFASDKVANVRFNLSKTILNILSNTNSDRATIDKIKRDFTTIISNQVNDSDSDVIFYSVEASKLINKI